MIETLEIAESDGFESSEPSLRDFVHLHISAAVASCTFLVAIAAFTLS